MHTLTLREIAPLTHDTYRMVFDRPAGFPEFTPGQASHLALDREGWRDETRPYTMVSDPRADELAFVIRSKPEHDGVSCRIVRLSPGDTVLAKDPAGAIEDRGPGIFIAAGVGLTPMIPILRARAAGEGALNGCTLILGDKEERDLLLREEWEGMEGLSVIYALSDEDVPGIHHGRIGPSLVEEVIRGHLDTFYVCGPKPMEEDVVAALRDHGVPADRIVTEDH
ncbi:MAG: flavodoxin reductase [Hasllibacter sp.]